MAWSFTGDRPVYIQIADRVKKAVLSGQYGPGEQIPAVRQLALEAAVNPNTVQHAFAELEHEGLIVSQGTLGRFVTEDREVIDTVRDRMARQIAETFVKEMDQLSLNHEQIRALIREVAL